VENRRFQLIFRCNVSNDFRIQHVEILANKYRIEVFVQDIDLNEIHNACNVNHNRNKFRIELKIKTNVRLRQLDSNSLIIFKKKRQNETIIFVSFCSLTIEMMMMIRFVEYLLIADESRQTKVDS